MGAGNCVLANDVPEHREVLRDAGVYYEGKRELTDKLVMLMQNEAIVREKGTAALKIAKEEYSWDRVVQNYEQVFAALIASRSWV
jgi:glycosyltransferase involved in cell wall biosynthesis